MYIADLNNYRIRKLTVATGLISTIAGTGSASFSGDGGPATSATLNSAHGVALDSSGMLSYLHSCIMIFTAAFFNLGNVYIADGSNYRIRKVTLSTGIISTIAGSSTNAGFSGDGGEATSATLNYAYGIAVDSTGIFYYATSVSF